MAVVLVDARVDAMADAHVDDAPSAESVLHDIFSQKASAPIYPDPEDVHRRKENDGPELEPSEQGFGFGRSGFMRRNEEPTGEQQGVLGHGAKYRRDAGATP